MLMDLIFIILSVFLLWKGADFVVDSASALASSFGISELTVGLTIVAMGTSLPEFMVTFLAALKNLPSISLSNVIGSNIFNLGIILGSLALIQPVPTNKTIIFRDGLFLLAIILLITWFGYDLLLARWAGGLLLCLFTAYLVWVGKKNKLPVEIDVTQRKAKWWDYPRLGLGILFLSLGANFLVEHASNLARHFGLSEWFIGVTIVAAGTSLPELATSLSAALKGKHQLLVGNLLGSDIFNFAGVLGITALFHPLSISPLGLFNLKIAATNVLLLLIFMRTNWQLSRWEGLVLILINLLRWSRDYLH